MLNNVLLNEEKAIFSASLDGKKIAEINICGGNLGKGSVCIKADNSYADTFKELSKEIGSFFKIPVSVLNSSEGIIHFEFSDYDCMYKALDYVLLRMAPCCYTSISRVC